MWLGGNEHDASGGRGLEDRVEESSQTIHDIDISIYNWKTPLDEVTVSGGMAMFLDVKICYVAQYLKLFYCKPSATKGPGRKFDGISREVGDRRAI